ncbi:MAG: hypothetical protein PVH17_05725 [Anaerolineae bacterium]|jgi:uncharacterized membrane protein YeaQ/YmgE (transglycosylase-associated protein family)
MTIILAVTLVLSVLSGWLLPIIFKSRRPYGVLGDILVCTIVAVVLAYVEWNWILPALGFEQRGWLAVSAAIGDPLGLGWICLWLMRKIKA